jgi:hypothetical protein
VCDNEKALALICNWGVKPVFNNHYIAAVVIFIIARSNSITLHSTFMVNHNFKGCPLAMCTCCECYMQGH